MLAPDRIRIRYAFRILTAYRKTMKQVCYGQNLVEAHLIRNHLEANGIDAILLGELLGTVKGGDRLASRRTLPFGWLTTVISRGHASWSLR